MSSREQRYDWVEVRALVPTGWHELVGGLLSEPPCTGVHFGPASLGTPAPPVGREYVRGFFPASADSADFRTALRARVAELHRRSAVEELAALELEFKPLPREDYARSWRKSWKPFRVGALAVVDPEWSGSERAPRPGERRLVLEPGGAFGTGRHPTTRRCLAELQTLIEPGARVVDAGCGSGILSVAALLFGARSALGFDVDPNAIPYARALADQNGVGEQCEFLTGSFEELAPRGAFDGLFANIYADVLQEHALGMAAALERGGWFLASGCPLEKEPPTRAALERAGLRIERRWLRGRWVSLQGRRA